MAGKRGRLASHPLHHIAVTAKRVNVKVEHREARLVEVRRQPTRRDRHADAIGAALAQRPRRSLDARGETILRMARTFAAELAEILDVVERDRGFAKTLVLCV